MRVPAGPTGWSWHTRTRRPRGKSAVDSDVVDAMGGHPVDARSRVGIRADDVPDGINAASKEELQVATVQKAELLFAAHVVEPSSTAPSALERLHVLAGVLVGVYRALGLGVDDGRLQPTQPVAQETDQSVADRAELHVHLGQHGGEEAAAGEGVHFD